MGGIEECPEPFTASASLREGLQEIRAAASALRGDFLAGALGQTRAHEALDDLLEQVGKLLRQEQAAEQAAGG